MGLIAVMPETRMPYTTRNSWDTIHHRLETAVQSVNGACIVTMSAIAVNGKPISWTRPDVLPFEPRCDADKMARFLQFGSVGVVESTKNLVENGDSGIQGE